MQAINPNISAQVFDKQSPEGQKDILQNVWAKDPKWGPKFQQLYDDHYGDIDEINNIKSQSGPTALNPYHDILFQFADDNDWPSSKYDTLKSPEFKQWFDNLSPDQQKATTLAPSGTLQKFYDSPEGDLYQQGGQPNQEVSGNQNPEFPHLTQNGSDYSDGYKQYVKDHHGMNPEDLFPQHGAGFSKKVQDEYKQSLEQQPTKTPTESLAQGIKAIFPNTPLNLDQMSVPELKKTLEDFQEHLAETPGHADNVAKLKALYDQNFGDGDIEAIKSQMPSSDKPAGLQAFIDHHSGPGQTLEPDDPEWLEQWNELSPQEQQKFVGREQPQGLGDKLKDLLTHPTPEAIEKWNSMEPDEAKHLLSVIQGSSAASPELKAKAKELLDTHNFDTQQLDDGLHGPDGKVTAPFAKYLNDVWGVSPANVNSFEDFSKSNSNGQWEDVLKDWEKAKGDYLPSSEQYTGAEPLSVEQLTKGVDWGNQPSSQQKLIPSAAWANANADEEEPWHDYELLNLPPTGNLMSKWNQLSLEEQQQWAQHPPSHAGTDPNAYPGASFADITSKDLGNYPAGLTQHTQDQNGWELKPGVAAFLESQGYGPQEFSALPWDDQLALKDDFSGLDPEQQLDFAAQEHQDEINNIKQQMPKLTAPDDVVKGMFDPHGDGFMPGVQSWLAKEYNETTQDDINNLSPEDWQVLSSEWDKLPSAQKKQFVDQEQTSASPDFQSVLEKHIFGTDSGTHLAIQSWLNKTPEQQKTDLKNLAQGIKSNGYPLNDKTLQQKWQNVYDEMYGGNEGKPGGIDLQSNGVPTAKQLEAWGVPWKNAISIATQDPELFESNLAWAKSQPPGGAGAMWGPIHDVLKDHDWPLQSGSQSSSVPFDAQQFANELGDIHGIPGNTIKVDSSKLVKDLNPEEAKKELESYLTHGDDPEDFWGKDTHQAHKDLYQKYFGGGSSGPDKTTTPSSEELKAAGVDDKWVDNLTAKTPQEFWSDYEKTKKTADPTSVWGKIHKHFESGSSAPAAAAVEPPQWDPQAFAEQYKEILPGSGSSLASGSVTPEKAQEKLKSLIEGNPGTAKTQQLQELHDQWFGGAPGAKKKTPTKALSPHYKALMERVDKLPASAFSEADLKKFRSKKFQTWFNKAPQGYRETLQSNPGIVIDDFDAKTYSPPVGGGDWEDSQGKSNKYYDVMGYPKSQKNWELPDYLRQNDPRADDVKFPQYEDQQETLPLSPGDKFAPHYGPLPIYRVMNLDLDHQADPSRAPSHLKTDKERKLWAQQQNARLQRIDSILNGDSSVRDPDRDVKSLKNWGKQYNLTDKEINDVAGMLYGQQGDLFDDEKWGHLKDFAKNKGIDIQEMHDLAQKLDVTPSAQSKGNYDHPELGKLILDYLENTKHRSNEGGSHSEGGLGWHWTRAINKMYKGVPAAGIGKSEMKATNRNLPIAISGLWTGQGEGGGHGGAYDPEHSGEKEHNLRSHAPVHVRRLQIRAPGSENQGYGSWHDTIDHGPMSLWSPGRYEEGDEFSNSSYAPGERMDYKPSLGEEVNKAIGGNYDTKLFDNLKPGYQADQIFAKLIHEQPNQTFKKRLEELYRDFFVGRPDLPTKPHRRRASLEKIKPVAVQARKRTGILTVRERVS